LYRIRLGAQSSDGRNLGLALNPRGGAWGGAVNALPGITPGGVFLIPPSTAAVGSNTQAAIEGKYAPGSGLSIRIQFMPAGGSSFPVRMIAVPY
jgi:hypothetical protein